MVGFFIRALGALGCQDLDIQSVFGICRLIENILYMGNSDGRQFVIANRNMLAGLAANPKFPEAKRIYDLLTQAAPAPAPVSVPALTPTSAANWDDWIRDLPTDTLKQKALLEQTDLQD